MAHKIESLRGMDDILPGEIEKWQWLEQRASIFFEGFGFKEIRTPILEYTELFSRGVGEGSDIVRKEMFSFKDRGDRDVTMRPEMTASVARSVIEKGLLSQAKSLRFYYVGPMFRAERPQAGRKRQFHQIGIEIINEGGVAPDLDAARFLYQFLSQLGVKGLELRINDLGTLEDQQKTAQKLKEYFSGINTLCEDCRDRLNKNVLRLLDCKNPNCQPAIEKAPWEQIAPKNSYFEDIQKGLAAWGIPFVVKRRLVRGLDYYNGLVFEISASGLGAQDALAGGGRYDRLYSDLGGKPTPCIGFSIGFERLLMALGESAADQARENVVYFAPVFGDDDFHAKEGGPFPVISKAVYELAQLGMKPVMGNHGLKMDNHLKSAIKARARYMVIFGADELKNGEWTFKDMDNKTQEKIKHGNLFTRIKKVNV